MPAWPFLLGWFAGWTLLLSRWRTPPAALLLLPGTAAHEFAHYAVALATRGRPQAPRLTPRATGAQRWQLGEVRFEPAAGRTALVALAPLYLVPLLAWMLWQVAEGPPSVGQAGAGYAFGLSIWAMWPSGTDWALAARDPVGSMLALGGSALAMAGVLRASGLTLWLAAAHSWMGA
jgi:hypothetical protein